MIAEDRYQRLYGLRNGNPYRSVTLNALTNPEHEQLLLNLAGYPPMHRIEEHVHGPSPSSAFLLTGRNATGRTSLAHAILHKYVTCKPVAPASFMLIVDREATHNARERVYGILASIRNAAVRRNRDMENALRDAVPVGTNASDLDASDLQLTADRLAHLLKHESKPALHLGLLVEDLPDWHLMELLETVFQYVDAAIVVTHKQYGTSDTARLPVQSPATPEWALRIPLPPLTGSQVSELTQDRWERAADVECPFELDGVRRAFDGRAEPVGTAMEWLHWLLHCRLENFGKDQAWPADPELGLPGEWIEKMIKLGESAPGAYGRGGYGE